MAEVFAKVTSQLDRSNARNLLELKNNKNGNK